METWYWKHVMFIVGVQPKQVNKEDKGKVKKNIKKMSA